MDTIDPGRRSENMRRIHNKHTKPEVRLRSLLHKMGYRFRLHDKDLPGKPDIVFSGRHKVIFVHGCFWHQHPGCREGRIPTSRRDYWEPKLNRNTIRDETALAKLNAKGWGTQVIWECELEGNLPQVLERIAAFLDGTESS